nr:MAG TPA: hypothetical protein [Caudoviricetes sp.]
MTFTNPGKIVRLRSRPNGHGSVYEANMWAQQHSDGLFSGRGVVRNTVADMNVLVGGTTDNPDVVLGKLPSGFLIALDIVGQQVIRITAPSSNKRIASVVAYSDNIALNSTDTNTTGSPSSCGLIVVYGSTSATPVAPTESQIRQAVTQDGATGSQAVIAVIANITTESSTTTITDEMIAINYGKLSSHSIDLTTMPDNKYTTNEQDTGQKWLDGRPIYRKVVRGTVNMTGGDNTSSLPHGIQGLSNRWELIRYYGNMRLSGVLSNNLVKQALPYIEGTHQSGITSITQTNITISGSYNWGSSEISVVLEYVK